MFKALNKLFLLPLVILLVVLGSACQSQSEPQPFSTTAEGDTLWGPGVYNDYLVGKQEQIIQGIVNLGTSFQSFDSTQIELAYDTLLRNVSTSIDQVERLTPYEGDTVLKPATLKLFSFYQDVTINEYRQITDVIAQGPENITQSDFNRIDSLTQKIAKLEVAVDANFEAAQSTFAKKYDMIILDNDFSPALDTTESK